MSASTDTAEATLLETRRTQGRPLAMYRVHFVLILMAALMGFIWGWRSLQKEQMFLFALSFLASAALIAYAAWFFARKLFSNSVTSQSTSNVSN